MTNEEIVQDMVKRFRKWDARGTPDPIIMNKILTNIKPMILRQAEGGNLILTRSAGESKLFLVNPANYGYNVIKVGQAITAFTQLKNDIKEGKYNEDIG